MTELPFDTADDGAVPLVPLTRDGFREWLAGEDAAVRGWLDSIGFEAAAGSVALLAGPDGRLGRALAGVPAEPGLWDYAHLPTALPAGRYALTADSLVPSPGGAAQVALGWALGAYRFARYKGDAETRAPARLVWPEAVPREAVARQAEATFLVRDLINMPANDMGPAALAEAAGELAARHGATFSTIVGDRLLAENYPAIHAVGRAAAEEPRLIDIVWGDDAAPRVTLVGKGVCFDTGGLDLKPAAGMKLMKKDMGGAANVLGLAAMIMAAELPVRLRVLIPAVENSVSGDAMRPLDVVRTRKGLTVEIGNTDAEGRVILADALAEASSEQPSLLIDFATLTGAARVALGTEVPALFCNDEDLAREAAAQAEAAADPLWRLPLWPGYRKQIDGKVADINNAPEGGYGGAITAALFLERFVAPEIAWAHIDLMAWNASASPGRPEGGEAMGMRAVYGVIAQRYG